MVVASLNQAMAPVAEWKLRVWSVPDGQETLETVQKNRKETDQRNPVFVPELRWKR